jgi:hypothetical protein
MKLYTFLDENDNIIEQVRAEHREEAIDQANSWKSEEDSVDTNTDFYSEELDD